MHESHVLRSRGGYVWCQQCGAYYSMSPLTSCGRVKLKRECQVATKAGRANLKRIREGLPPDSLASKLAKRLGTLSPEHALAPPQHERHGSIDPAAPEDHTLSLQDPSPTTLSIAEHDGHASIAATPLQTSKKPYPTALISPSLPPILCAAGSAQLPQPVLQALNSGPCAESSAASPPRARQRPI